MSTRQWKTKYSGLAKRYDRVDYCPTCHAKLDAGICEEYPLESPNPGDVSVCCYCQAILIFTEYDLRLATKEELAKIKCNPLLEETMKIVEKHGKLNPRRS